MAMSVFTLLVCVVGAGWSAVPLIQKRGEAAARAMASERTGDHRGLQVRERAIKEYMAKTCTVDEIARRAGVTGTHSLSPGTRH